MQNSYPRQNDFCGDFYIFVCGFQDFLVTTLISIFTRSLPHTSEYSKHFTYFFVSSPSMTTSVGACMMPYLDTSSGFFLGIDH